MSNLPPAGHSGDQRRGARDRRTVPASGGRRLDDSPEDRRHYEERRKETQTVAHERRTSVASQLERPPVEPQAAEDKAPVHIMEDGHVRGNPAAAVTGPSDAERIDQAVDKGIPTRTQEEGEIKTSEGEKVPGTNETVSVGAREGVGDDADAVDKRNAELEQSRQDAERAGESATRNSDGSQFGTSEPFGERRVASGPRRVDLLSTSPDPDRRIGMKERRGFGSPLASRAEVSQPGSVGGESAV